MVSFSLGMMPTPMLAVAGRGSVALKLVAVKLLPVEAHHVAQAHIAVFNLGIYLRAVAHAHAQLVAGLEENAHVVAKRLLGLAREGDVRRGCAALGR